MADENDTPAPEPVISPEVLNHDQQPENPSLDPEDRPDFSKIGKGKKTKETENPFDEPDKAEPVKEEKPDSKNLEEAKPKKEKPEKAKYEPKLEDIPDDDSDLDSIKPKKGFSTEQEKNFRQLGEIAKKERAIARLAIKERNDFAAKVKEYEGKQGELPEEVKTRLSHADKLAMMMDAENDPLFQKDFVGKITQAETNLFDFLKSKGMKDNAIKEIKDSGVEGWGLENWKEVEKALNEVGDTLSVRKVQDLRVNRLNAIEAKDQKLKELSSDRETYHKSLAERELQDQVEWAKKAEKSATEISAKFDWAWDKKVPANASPEQRAAIEAHNARQKELGAELAKSIEGCYTRDPDTVVKIAMEAMHSQILLKENETLTRDRDKHSARVKELETQIAKIKGAGRIAHDTSPVSPQKPNKNEVDYSQDAASALGSFLRNKNK